MLDLANLFRGWTASVYKFGCAFIHLSNLHDYRHQDPLQSLPASERSDVIEHLRYYHGGPNAANPTFDDVVPLLPRVFAKIAGNLDCYLRSLESDGDIDR